MKEKSHKMISAIVAAVMMCIVIIVAIIANQPEKENSKSQPAQTERKAKETEQEVSTESTKEEMTEAPKDTSDWEIHKAQDTTPDTGAAIE